jgi:transposase-like protein
MKVLSKQRIGYCPVCGSDLSDETGTEVGQGDWTCHKVRLLTTVRDGAKYYKCPDCNAVWDAETGKQLSDEEIEGLGVNQENTYGL